MSAEATEAAIAKGFHWPPPIEASTIPYSNPPPKNPVVSGLPLKVLSTLVANVGPLQQMLWDNAGFGELDALEKSGALSDFHPRLDPTVIPFTAPPIPEVSSTGEAQKKDGDECFHSAKDITDAYLQGRTTPVAHITRVLEALQQDPHDLCVVALNTGPATLAAEESERRYKENSPLPGGLDGVPIIVKDEVDVEGLPTMYGTNKGNVATETSWCVKKLIEAGAIVVAKSNMHELGLDTTNNNPNWGTPRNPYNKNCYTGGSSGGSAYAVGAGLVPIAVGADGGGSIRLPANYCGVFGLKPTHNRVSTRPTASIAPSVGVVGPIAATIDDLELSYRIMATPDPQHSSAAHFPPPGTSPKTVLTPKKILGIYKDWYNDCDAEVLTVVNATLEGFKSSGYEVVEITIPHLTLGRSAHALTILSEIASSAPLTHAPSLTPPTQILVSIASRTPLSTFLAAQKLRSLLMSHLSSLFAAHSENLILFSPVTPTTAPKIGSERDVERGGYGVSNANASLASMRFVWLANFLGLPSISVPAGMTEEGMPVGVMGVGAWGAEEVLLAFGREAVGGRARGEAWVDVGKGEV
ncbi:hypothetical protein RUND412_008239 [Rhizina undulata]